MMLYTKIQPWRFLGSGEEDTFLVFLPYMGMAAILVNGPWPYVQIFNPPLTEGSTWSFRGFREEIVQSCGRTDDDGRQVITIAHPEPCSGELKICEPFVLTYANNNVKLQLFMVKKFTWTKKFTWNLKTFLLEEKERNISSICCWLNLPRGAKGQSYL